MHALCVQRLGYKPSAAFKRLTAARTIRKFPGVLVAIADGKIDLSAVVTLAPHLTPDNADELVAAAKEKTLAELERMIDERFRRPMLQATPSTPAEPSTSGPAGELAARRATIPDQHRDGHSLSELSPQLDPRRVEPPRDSAAEPAGDGLPGELAPGRVEPTGSFWATAIAPQRFPFQCFVDQETRDLFQHARALMGHEVPSGDMALVLKGLLKNRRGTSREAQVRRDHLVLRCGGGITYVGSDYADHFFTGNTSALNAGSGLSIPITPAYGEALPSVVSNNIAFGNTGWGLRWSGPGQPVLGCNDWFENEGGATNGVAPGATDLSVDPLFCDPANDDLSIRADSPLIGGACGTIGAPGIGCDASTEVLVALFTAEASDQGVGLRWRLGGDEEPTSVSIERSKAEQGPWQAIATERSREGDLTVDWDRGAEPGRRYWYRLALTTTDGQQNYPSPIEVLLASPAPAFDLRAIGPNPASGPVAIEYTLPLSTTIDLTVHDLMGRELTRLASGVQTQGLHVMQWTGEVRGGRAGPGVYFVRLAYPGGQRSQRILLRR
jgi:hypothetical protein